VVYGVASPVVGLNRPHRERLCSGAAVMVVVAGLWLGDHRSRLTAVLKDRGYLDVHVGMPLPGLPEEQQVALVLGKPVGQGVGGQPGLKQQHRGQQPAQGTDDR